MSDGYSTPEKEFYVGVSFWPETTYNLAGLETAISGLGSLTYVSALTGVGEGRLRRSSYVRPHLADMDARFAVEFMRVHRVSLNSPLEIVLGMGAAGALWPSYHAAMGLLRLYERFHEARVSRHRANADIAEHRLRETDASLALSTITEALNESETLIRDGEQAKQVEQAARTLPTIESMGTPPE